MNAVRGVSLRVSTGEFVTIMGPSGSGKSTLMHLMGALDTPTAGRAVFQGQDLQSLSDRQRSLLRRDRIGFVFQAFNLLPTLTAAENVALPLLLGGTNRRRGDRTGPAAAWSGSGWPTGPTTSRTRLSGGEMQRVAVARALVADPEAVLCDEPTGNLDTRHQPRNPVAAGDAAGTGPAGRRHGHARPGRRPVRHPAGPHPRRADRVRRSR